MRRIQVVPVHLPEDARKFVRVWWSVYQDDPHWVPPLIRERVRFLDPGRNPYFQHADVQCFVAIRDGRPVGTISAQIDHAVQEIEPGVGFFGFYEFPEDEAIARCLLGVASGWLRERGMSVVRGPFSFSTHHQFGLLVDGFDTAPCLLNPHGRRHYPETYERLGLSSCQSWYAYWLEPGPLPEVVGRISDRLLGRHPELELRPLEMRHYDTYLAHFYEIYNDAWSENWGHAELARDEFMDMARELKALVDPRLVWFAFLGDECVAGSITFPDVGPVLRRMNGHLLPFGWFHWAFRSARVDVLRVFALGVKRRYQHLPLGAPLYARTWEAGLEMGVRGAEASLILADNHRMRGALEKLGARIYKEYRSYERSLDEIEPCGCD